MEKEHNTVTVEHSTDASVLPDDATANGMASGVPALIVAGSKGAPQRVGEVLWVHCVKGARFWFGRGAPRPEEEDTRANLFRQRPGEATATGSLLNPRISRRQLVLSARADGAIDVQNVGRCRLLLNGGVCDQGTVYPGDTLELKDELLLYAAPRPRSTPKASTFDMASAPAFGYPDADGIVGEGPASWRLREQIAFLAKSPGHVLVLGESGSGKELCAQALHRQSMFGQRPLVARNAATFPAGLIDAELFGNAKDYPNVGQPARPGLVGAADGSTLFLDEIGELPIELQNHLLRVLDGRGEYQRLGEAQVRTSHLRVVVATNRSITELKPDLAARLPLRLVVPGLNERCEDIPLLVRHLLVGAATQDSRLAARFFDEHATGIGVPRVDFRLLRALLQHEYTLHVRELLTLLWTSIGSSAGDRLELTPEVASALSSTSSSHEPPVSLSPAAIQECLDRHAGVQEKVWRELGMRNRYVLKRLISKHGLRSR